MSSIIGIDLGTTNSVMAVMQGGEGQVVQFPMRHHHDTVPPVQQRQQRRPEPPVQRLRMVLNPRRQSGCMAAQGRAAVAQGVDLEAQALQPGVQVGRGQHLVRHRFARDDAGHELFAQPVPQQQRRVGRQDLLQRL